MKCGCCRMLAVTALALWTATAFAAGAPIAGVTYHYNPPLLPNPDDGNGEWTWNFAGKDLTETKLTDGILGSLAHIPASEPVAFTNGTWVGYNNDTAFEGHPRVDFDLGGMYQVQSVEVQYLIEAPPFIFAPQACSADDPDCFGGVDALTVSGSTDGVNYSSLGMSNAFEPIFGPTGSVALGTVDARTAVIDMGPGGVAASHIRVDVRTPYTWILLGEVTINQVPEPTAMSLLGIGLVGVTSRLRRRRSS